jgi:glycosidase
MFGERQPRLLSNHPNRASEFQSPMKVSSLILRLSFVLSLLLVLAVPIAQAGDNNINWTEVRHDSRDTLYRSPQGAVPTGTGVRLRLRALNDDLTAAQVRVWNDRVDVSNLYNMTRVASGVTFPGDATSYEFWEVTLPASANPTIYWYRFILIDGTDTDYYEDDDQFTGGAGQVYDDSPDRSWQLTHYDPTFTTPDWVKDAVIYQIFPDRFRDGNPANNNAAGEFHYGANDSIVRSNTTNWNTALCDPRSVAGSPALCANRYSQNFYGGDLQGIIDKLSYLDSLGITAIYLNPIFESPSNHKYDTTDFMRIDDNLGDLATFQSLVTQANGLGIRIILDGVFNHSSSDSIYFDRYSRWNAAGNPTPTGTNDASGACESQASPRIGWYTFFPYTGTGSAPCSDNRDYPKWFGIFDSLPVFQHDFPAVRDYFINNGTASVGPYWVQWADGWRLDVAGEIDHGQINSPADDYWEDFRAAVRAVNPDTYIVGEEWNNATSWTVGGEWDATMNYPMGTAALGLWRDENFVDNDPNVSPQALSPSQFVERVEHLGERYAPEAFYAMMNLMDSHDTNRALFKLDHNTDQNNTALYANPNYDWSDALNRLRGAFLVHLTLPGAPTIYYGDEVGTINPPAFDGSNWQDDPYNRVPYPWLDQTGTPFYTHMQSQVTQDALRNYVSMITAARNAHPALRTGAFDPILVNDAGDILVYGRKLADGSDAALVVVNRSATTQNVTIDVSGYLPAGLDMSEVLTSTAYTVSATGELIVNNVPANGGALLVPTEALATSPAAPASLTVTPANGQITLNWAAAANADSYDVYRSRLSGGGYTFVANTTNTTYQDTGLTNSTRYYYVVVGKNNTTLLESGWSNEANAVPGYDLSSNAWYNLQWPPTLNWTLNALIPTDMVYGQIWVQGVTDASSTPVAGLMAQVGFGPQTAGNDLPSDAWTWFPMTHNPGYDFGQNNDEFQGTMLPSSATPGTYYYTTRYSGDGGVTWFYTDKDGPPASEDQLGVLTINAPTDTTAPAAPTNLAVTGTTAVSISLAWDAHPNTDGDLYGFEIWREQQPAGAPEPSIDAEAFDKIATVTNPAATSFVDNTVTTNTTYSYYITALDTSLNRSAASNTVTGTAERREVQVTFVANVPAGTPGTVYVAGSFPAPYPQWTPDGIALTQVSPTQWSTTLTLLDGTQLQYKFARGEWDRVEKGADGNFEISDRTATVEYGAAGTQTLTHTVENWRDPYVIAFSPAANASNVPTGTTIIATWNQAMNEASAEDAAGFTVTGPGGAVAGTLVYDDASKTVTFTPSAALANGTYTVLISGRTDAGGDAQKVNATWMFTVGAASLIDNGGFATDITGWYTWGQPTPGAFVHRITGGVLEFYRNTGTQQAVIVQNTGDAIAAGTSLDISLQLGNSSAIRKRALVLVHDINFSEMMVCTFWLPPNQPLTTYAMQARTTAGMTNASISIYASTADGTGYYQLDNVSLTASANTYNETRCIDPNAPGAGTGADSANYLTNGNFAAATIAPWFTYALPVGSSVPSQLTSGVFEFYRNAGTTNVQLGQTTSTAASTGTLIEGRIDLGNSSASRKRVMVLLHDADFSDLAACSFYLPASTPLTTHVIRAYASEAWTNASVSVYASSADGQGWYQVDNANLRTRPTMTIDGTECYGLGATLPPASAETARAPGGDTAPVITAPETSVGIEAPVIQPPVVIESSEGQNSEGMLSEEGLGGE